jgi:hypothetical protein
VAKIIVHLTIEITDTGTVKIQRGGWSIERAPGTTGAITPEQVAAIGKAIEGAPAMLPLSAETAASSRGRFVEEQLPPAPPAPARRTVVSRIVDAGWMQEESVEALVKMHGVSRVKDVADWIARKIARGELVRAPGSLLVSTLGRKSAQDAR